MNIVGTCSVCGGQVNKEVDGSRECLKCGALATKRYGPVIDMEPKEGEKRDEQILNEDS